METAKRVLKRGAVGALIGAVVGPVVGLVFGALVASVVWLVLGLIEQLPGGELAQIVPWASILGIIVAGLSIPVGAATGGILVAGKWSARQHWKQALIGGAIGIIVGAIVTPRIWNLQVNAPIALLTLAILGLVGAVASLIIASWSRRFVPRAPR